MRSLKNQLDKKKAGYFINVTNKCFEGIEAGKIAFNKRRLGLSKTLKFEKFRLILGLFSLCLAPFILLYLDIKQSDQLFCVEKGVYLIWALLGISIFIKYCVVRYKRQSRNLHTSLSDSKLTLNFYWAVGENIIESFFGENNLPLYSGLRERFTIADKATIEDELAYINLDLMTFEAAIRPYPKRNKDSVLVDKILLDQQKKFCREYLLKTIEEYKKEMMLIRL